MKNMNTDSMLIKLESEKKRLETIIQKVSHRLKNAPEGNVRVIKHKNSCQYFHITKKGDTTGIYIPVANRQTAVSLIQKRYDQKVLIAAQKQRTVIEYFLHNYDPACIRKIYTMQSEIRKSNIIPVELPDQEYENNWQSVAFTPKGFSPDIPEHYTYKGERVRSKSEVMIADILNQENIPYKYECPLKLGDNIIYPDFTILRLSDRKEIYWEHLGMMDDQTYCNNALQRIREYEKHKIYPGNALILTMETGRIPINSSVIKEMINHYCR